MVLFGRSVGALLAVGYWWWTGAVQGEADSNPEMVIARKAFQQISNLKVWGGGQTSLPGCYIMDGTVTGGPEFQTAYFTAAHEKGFAYVTCKTGPVGGNENGEQIVSAHIGLEAMATFDIEDEFYTELGKLTVPLQELEIRSMNIGGMNGGQVPSALMKLDKLLNLKLENNAIAELPTTIKNFKQLNYLSLTKNKLAELPDISDLS